MVLPSPPSGAELYQYIRLGLTFSADATSEQEQKTDKRTHTTGTQF